MLTTRLTYLCALSVVALAASTDTRDEQLPLVDLDYAIHQPILDTENDLYTYKNIRYADPPLGKLRFKHPVPISTVNRTVNDGSYGFGCHQGYPASVVDELSWEGESREEARQRLTYRPLWGEDCLFLNVVVPKAVIQKTKLRKRGLKTKCGEKLAPVTVWIYGGAHLMGYKDQADYNPVGLMARSQEDGNDGMIHVAMNYRLAMFGFLHSKGKDNEVEPNAGLLDTRLALEWVRDNIRKFGGDPENVTVRGQSAGAASIMFHLTARGGKAEPLFQKAIISSPGYTSRDYTDAWAITLDTATRVAGKPITNARELAALTEEELREINSLSVFETALPIGPYALLPDGDYVLDWPGPHLLRGEFDKTPTLIVGNTANETLPYFPAQGAGFDLDTLIYLFAGPLGEKTLTQISELYPPANETHLYDTEYARTLFLSTELTFGCYVRQLSAAYKNQTYNYQFDVKPASHSADLPFHFYGSGRDEKLVDVDAALALQRYWTEFIKQDKPGPGEGDAPVWPIYGDEGRVIQFVEGGAFTGKENIRTAERCLFWQKIASGQIS